MSYVIERGVAVPGSKMEGVKETLLAMKPGDSVLIPDNRPAGVFVWRETARRIGSKITTKIEGDSYRVWLLQHRAPKGN
jgi:hypothetical protein